jgi:flagellum-specific peptidoglycan hydrolase FlgJ
MSAQQDFINVAGPAAEIVMAQFDIPASVTIGQAILESDWGNSELAAKDKNYFGFKCVNANSPGPIAIGCNPYETTECTPDCHPVTAYFRVYASMTDSFRDYATLLTRSGLYDSALPHRHEPDAFIRAVAAAGYATDPNYANKVINLMTTWNLYRFDTAPEDLADVPQWQWDRLLDRILRMSAGVEGKDFNGDQFNVEQGRIDEVMKRLDQIEAQLPKTS